MAAFLAPVLGGLAAGAGSSLISGLLVAAVVVVAAVASLEMLIHNLRRRWLRKTTP